MVDKFFSTLDDGYNQLGIIDRVDVDRGFVVLRGIEAGKNCDLVLTDVDGLVGTAQKKIVIHVATNPIFDAMTIDGDLTVTGGLNVAGVKTQINSVDLEVKDNKILLNKGETGAGVSLGLAGIEIDRGSKPRVGFIWEEVQDQWTFSQKNLGNIAAPISGTQVGDRNYNDARYTQQTLNLSDLTDAAAARSNIDVYSKSESDARFLNHGPNGATEELFLDTHSIRFQTPAAPGFDQFWYDTDDKVFHFVSAGASDRSVGNSTLKATLFDGDATNALHLGNYEPSDYPRKVENATITGAWTISNDFAVATGKKIDGRDLDVDGAVLDSINGAGDGLVVKSGNDTFTRRAITVGAGLTVANGNGIDGNPLIDVDDFTITLAGDASGSVTITDLMSSTLNLEVVGFYDSAESDARYVNVTGDTMSGDLSFSVGRVVLTDGTEAQPALTFADSDNGLYLAGPNSIGLSTAGVQRIGVDETMTTIRTNLLVTGANTTVKSAVVNFDTPRIILNKPGTAGYGVAGLHIERGTQQDATWFFDENNEYWTPGAGYLAVTNAPNQDVHVANRGYNDTRYLRISNNLSDLTDPVSARVALGLRDMAIQSKANVDIQGGMINGVEIGYGLAGKAKFTDLAANGTIRLNGMKLPSVDGINGQVLTTDGTGNLFWNTPVVYSVTSTTGGNSLVTDGVGPAFVLKTIKAGTDVAIDATADDLTVRVTGLLHSVEEDTTPALGGNLDVNGFAIVTTEVDGDIALVPDGNGKVRLDGHFWPNTDGTAGQVLRTNGGGELSWVGGSGIAAEYTSANYTASDTNISGHLYGIDQKLSLLGTADSGFVGEIDSLKTRMADAEIALDGKLSFSGGTMTGDLMLVGNPTAVNHAVTKGYVDGHSLYYVAPAGGTAPTLFANGLSGLDAYSASDQPTDYRSGWTMMYGNRGAQMTVNWDCNDGSIMDHVAIRVKDDTQPDWSAWRSLAWHDEITVGLTKLEDDLAPKLAAALDVAQWGITSSNGIVEFEKNVAVTHQEGTSTGAYALDVQISNHCVHLDADTTVSFSQTMPDLKAVSLSVWLKQDAIGGRLVTWPGSVKWAGGVAPVLSTGADAMDLVVLTTWDQGITWYGALSGVNFS